jgi:osmotically-inducible protein OsmY
MSTRTLRKTTLTFALLCGMIAAVLGTTVAAEQRCTKHAAVAESAADRRATDEVRRRIATDDTVSDRARQVEVTTIDGVVTLRGSVDNEEDGTTLASLAESVPGVRHVDDRLRVESQEPSRE